MPARPLSVGGGGAPERGGSYCNVAVLPQGYGLQLTRRSGSFTVDALLNDARDPGSPVQSFYLDTAVRLASVAKRSARTTSEGLVMDYVHTGGKLGVLVEVNCETDFVAKNEAFSKLARGIAMTIAASPNVEYVSQDDVPADARERETQAEMNSEDLEGKPEEIKEKMAAAKDFLDRAGFVKTDKVEVKSESPLFILPPKENEA